MDSDTLYEVLCDIENMKEKKEILYGQTFLNLLRGANMMERDNKNELVSLEENFDIERSRFRLVFYRLNDLLTQEVLEFTDTDIDRIKELYGMFKLHVIESLERTNYQEYKEHKNYENYEEYKTRNPSYRQNLLNEYPEIKIIVEEN